MPNDYLENSQIREALSKPSDLGKDGFKILANISRLVDEGGSPAIYQELILRALDQRTKFGSASGLLDALVRQVGLFPYLDPSKLGTADEIAWEFHRPAKYARPDRIPRTSGARLSGSDERKERHIKCSN
jgi:hypothetical protein